VTDNPVSDGLADLRLMLRIRRFEEAVRDLRVAGDIVGSVHLEIGQEAIPVGTVSELDFSRDAVFATYRGHGWAIACGSQLQALFAELLGRRTGLNGGRGSSAYLSDPDHGFYGENSIVGGGAPTAVGAALAARYDGSGRVAIAVIGDGALNQGSVHEAINFAAVLSAPIVFIVENNGYSELTPIRDMVRIERLADRAAAYGLPAEQVDGNDPIAVRDAVGAAVLEAREGTGPSLVEAITERVVGHYIGDAEGYRPEGEVARAALREPIVRLRQWLASEGVDTAVLEALDQEVKDEIVLARDRALADPLADPATAKDAIYA
jgi:pyruvate dehydrogenase E1 component alpha subunit